jgi:hypothetical protein
MKAMTIEALKRRYKNEWVLVEVLERDKLGEPTKVKLLKHSKNRDEIYDALLNFKDKPTYQFYTGRFPKKGYAIALHGASTLRSKRDSHRP